MARDLSARGLGSRAPHVIGQGSAALSLTGSTSETTLATVTIPGGLLGSAGHVEIVTFWSAGANNTNTKTLNIKFGASTVASQNLANTRAYQNYSRVANRANNSQIFFNAATSFAITSNAPGTAAVDTTADVAVTLTGTLAVGTDTMTLESYLVVAYPKP